MVGLFGVVGMAVVQALPRLLWMVTAGVVLSGWCGVSVDGGWCSVLSGGVVLVQWLTGH
jgi:hypothetical protein